MDACGRKREVACWGVHFYPKSNTKTLLYFTIKITITQHIIAHPHNTLYGSNTRATHVSAFSAIHRRSHRAQHINTFQHSNSTLDTRLTGEKYWGRTACDRACCTSIYGITMRCPHRDTRVYLGSCSFHPSIHVLQAHLITRVARTARKHHANIRYP